MAILQRCIYSFLFLCVSCMKSNLFDYYTNLINSELKRSANFPFINDTQNEKPFTTEYIEYGTFDHIVVGAGSAGAIIASRLSEDSFREVLLLEAGGPATNFTEIPAMTVYLINTEYNWNYYSTRQNAGCLGMKEKKCYYPRGKVLGGSSGVNALIFTRGSRKIFDNWCAQGNPGWCYEDVLPFFKKFENFTPSNSTYRGIGGYVNVEYVQPNIKQQRMFIDANIELGRPLVDYNAFRQEGVGIMQLNTKNGRRSSTNEFLKAASKRSNLKVLTHSQVTRILINRKTKKAFGVLFAKDNKYYVAKSRSDVVLSAGTVGSPQTLMLSGVGPKRQLNRLRIPVIKDLSVGENFQDHMAFNILHFVTNFSVWDKDFGDHVKDFLNGYGALTDTTNGKAIAYLRTNLSDADDFSDIELMLIGTNSSSPLIAKFLNYGDELYRFGHPTENLSQIFTVAVVLLRPNSRGYVKLKSRDPFDYPTIDPKSLSDSKGKDIETMYKGILQALKLLNTNAFKRWNVQLHHLHLPACKAFEYMSKEYWYCHLRQASAPFAHMSGTCKMGPDPLRGAVVDHQLKVHGIQNLRVADASIMPSIPNAHINAAAMMIGEKAADLIRQ